MSVLNEANNIDSILIVGGGTAGWMTALYLSQKLKRKTHISLVESEDIGIIGVGEGSTPYLKSFFDELGIEESVWMAETDATFKAGIRFDNWCKEPACNSYFHPFFNEFDQQPAEMFFYNSGLKRRGYQANTNPDHYFTAAFITDQFRSPKIPENTHKHIDYAYHFDSVKLARFLREKAKSNGVNHIVANVNDVAVDEDGNIPHVNTECGKQLEADFFVDCTGFRGLLLQNAMERPFHSYQDWLFNDAAVAIQTPTSSPHKYKAQTRSKALSSGWMWQIPLTSRWGNGYVYSSRYLSKEAAEQELKEELGISQDEDVKVKHLKMKMGRVKEHWHKNCVAIGLSQGFIEPLEATALMLVQFAIQNLTETFNRGTPNSDDVTSYNDEINRLFEGVKDYITLHYLLNSRSDSAYWIDVREKTRVSDRIEHLLKAWDGGKDFEMALNDISKALVYLRPSWYCILSGMGRHPENLQSTEKAGPVEQAINYCEKVAEAHFPLLNNIHGSE